MKTESPTNRLLYSWANIYESWLWDINMGWDVGFLEDLTTDFCCVCKKKKSMTCFVCEAEQVENQLWQVSTYMIEMRAGQ